MQKSLSCEGKLKRSVTEKGICIIEIEDFLYVFYLNQFFQISVVISWVNHNNIPVVGSKKRYKAVGIGIL